jgi:predicted Zn-dependent peptidase
MKETIAPASVSGQLVYMFRTEKLSNGITVVGEEISYLRSVSIGILVGAGVRTESLGNAGISHFLEHMLFKGTKTKNAFQIAETLDEIGGRLNAYTTKEFTMFHATVLDKYLMRALDLLSDLFHNSTFNEEYIEMEKNVVLEEIRMSKDVPEDMIHDLFMEKLWGNHPLGKNILGDVDQIKAINKKDLIEYTKKLYVPQNVMVSVAGNFDYDQILNEISLRFSERKSRSFEFSIEKPKVNKGSFAINKKTEQVHLCLGGKGYSYNDDNRFKLTVINSVLGGSMSSRLFQEIREKRGLVYNIYSYYSFYKEAGLFAIYAGASPKNYEEVVELIIKELDMIANKGITESELSKAKEHIKGNIVISLENSTSRMNWNAKNIFYLNKVFPLQELFEKIDSITLEAIHHEVKEKFAKENLLLATIGPFEK